MKDLLKLPARTAKPRQEGITHVLDRGLSVVEIDSLVEVAGDYLDLVKLGWGTAVATANLERQARALSRARDPGHVRRHADRARDRPGPARPRSSPGCTSSRLDHIELSDGTIDLEHDRKLELIARLAKEFTVLSEVGSKDDTRIMAPFRWVEQIESELEAGAWKVIAEARESGTVGIFRHDGEVRMGLIDEIVHAIDPARILFEAPRKDQQVWFVRRLGPDVNLGNITPEDVLSLETIRIGLRSDTAVVDHDD